MTTIANTFASKLAVAFVAIAMMFSLVAPAQAQTAEELQAQIDTLMATINALQAQLGTGTTAPATSADAYVFTRSLTNGATGADVTALQNYLIGAGFTIPAGATGYYGSQTTAAVAAWQAANGVAPAVGYFGPVSQAKYNMVMAAMDSSDDSDDSMDDSDDSSDDSDNSTSLGNDEGDITTVNSASADESNLEEGQTGGVLAFDLEIEGDVEVNRIDVFAAENGTASDNADDYFVEASLWVDGDKISTIDVDDFDEDNYAVIGSDDYRLRFSGLDLVFEDGDEPEFQVSFEMLGSLDSADLASTWDAELDSIRFVDGEGFTDSVDSIAILENFGFDAEDVADLKISKSSDNPDATTIEVDADDQTDDVDVLIFEIEEKNGVDVTVEDLTITIVTATPAEDVVVASAAIYDGSTELDSANVPSTGIVLFENMGLDIDADETVELTVKLTFEDTNDGVAYTGGETVTVSYTSITDAEDANGNDEGDMSITGSANGETHQLFETGLVVEVVSAETNVTAEDGTFNDLVEFNWELDVTAFGDDDVYVTSDIAQIVAAATADLDFVYLVTNPGTALTGVSGTISSDADEVTGDDTAYGAVYNGETFFIIESGTTETFTINVSGTNVTDSKQVQAALTSIEWTTDLVEEATAEDGSTAAVSAYAFELADDSETPFKTVN